MISRLRMRVIPIAFLTAGLVPEFSFAAESAWFSIASAGKLSYKADARGDTIPDFSNCGYLGGGVALPAAPVKVTLGPGNKADDDTARIQKALDAVAAMPLDVHGLRGAVLLKNGTYRIGSQLHITGSGVVLRGEGDATTLVAAGNKQRELIRVGSKEGITEQKKTMVPVTDVYVPVGAHAVTVKDGSRFKVGDKVILRRTGNAAWIHAIKMDQIAGRPGHEDSTKQWQAFDLPFDRVVTAVDGNKVTLDAPLACAIDQQWGGGSLTKYEDQRIEHCGVEHLRSESEFNPKVQEKLPRVSSSDEDASEKGAKRAASPANPQLATGSYFADEDHATYLVRFDNVKNAWARDLTAVHYYHGPAAVGRNAKWVTVQDCRSLDPVSVITGGRRYPYLFEGQLSLFLRCYSDKARHAFVVSSRVCGPNAFVECTSDDNYATSEPHHRWSVGGLYDNVKAKMAFQDRQWMGSGHGWAGADYVAWNCEGSLVCQMPPTAHNWAIGFVGKKEPGAFERPDGHWESLGKHVAPKSLYLQQLQDRLGKSAVQNIARVGWATPPISNDPPLPTMLAAVDNAAAGAAIADAKDQVSATQSDAGWTLSNTKSTLSLSSDVKTVSLKSGPSLVTAPIWSALGDKPTVTLIDIHDPAGNGKGIELTSKDGAKQRFWLYDSSPFLCTNVTLTNASDQSTTTHDITPFTATLTLTTPIKQLKWFGSDGLGDGPAGKPSYTFLSLVDPKTRGGAVGGWVTHERGSGIVIGAPAKTDPATATISATSEFGRLLLAPHQSADSETFVLAYFDDCRQGLESFADLTARINKIDLVPPMCGYSTWYHARASDEKKMAQLSDWTKQHHLDEYGFNFLQIDDGWQIHRRDFTTHKPNGPYPSGMKQTADAITKNGYVAGLWLTPFGWQGRDFTDDKPLPNVTALKDHTDWFVHKEDGSVYTVRWAGDSLDMSNPEARKFLSDTIHRMVDDWGYRLLKIDGLWAGMAVKILYPSPEYRDDNIGDAVFHDPTKTNEEVYRDGLRLVREASGGQNKTFILGCNIAQNMRTLGGSIGLVDSMRIGPDIKADWSAVVRCAKPAGWLYFLNGRVWWNDPDCLMLREPLTLDMGRAWGSFIGISGQLHLVSEWLPDLPADRLDVLKRTIPNHHHLARPVDLFEHEMPQQWQLTWGDAAGRHDVVALFNWAMPASATNKSTAGTGQEEPTNPGAAARKLKGESRSAKIHVDLQQLGMPAGKYVGFDFWRNEFIPEFEGSADFELPPGSCKVLALSKVSDHPQIVSTSRHVTQGLVELSDVQWDAGSRTLRGKSKVVGNDPYELRLHTAGLKLASAALSSDDNGAGATAKSVPPTGQTLRVQIHSPETRVVAWELRFE